jgi:biotin transport system ATP-binding protein
LLFLKDIFFAHPGGPELFGGLSLGLPRGGFLAILGANGSGKSTLLDILSGISRPLSGTVALDGSEKNLRDGTALVPENPDHYILGATPCEELSLCLRANDIKEQRERKEREKRETKEKQGTEGKGKEAKGKEEKGKEEKREEDKGKENEGEDGTFPGGIAALAEKWSLTPLLDTPVEHLSRGEKKRLALASALARRPGVILFDEPFSGLDYPGILSLTADLAALKKDGATVAVATHEPGFVENLCETWLLLGKPGPLVLKREELSGELLSERGVRPFL